MDPEKIVLANKRLCGREDAERSVRTSSCSTPQVRLNCLRRRARALGRRTGRDRDKTWSQFEISTRRTFTERVESHACRIDRWQWRRRSDVAAMTTDSNSGPDRGMSRPTATFHGPSGNAQRVISQSLSPTMLPACWPTRPWPKPYVRPQILSAFDGPSAAIIAH